MMKPQNLDDPRLLLDISQDAPSSDAGGRSGLKPVPFHNPGTHSQHISQQEADRQNLAHNTPAGIYFEIFDNSEILRRAEQNSHLIHWLRTKLGQTYQERYGAGK